MLKTVPKTPQQNGVAERMNRTLNERAKSTRLHAGLPKMFWEDSVTLVAYLINRVPSVPLGFRILKEEWKGKEASLAHLRVFGYDSYVKVKDVARDNLDAKSMKCTFIGYGSDEMGYCFWDSKSHKVIQSRDVTFNEDSLYGAKSPSGSSNASEGSKNYRSFKDSGRSDEEDSKVRASSEERGFETLQLQRSTKESRAPVRYSPSTYYLLLTENGKPESYSDALSSKEFGTDYNEIFSPVVKMTTIKLVLSFVAVENLHLKQLDVKTSFLHGKFDEDIYMTQPEGFHSAGKEENLVCKLKKVCSNMAKIKKLKRQLSQEFKMKDLGLAKQILGMSIIIDRIKVEKRLFLDGFSDSNYEVCLNSGKSTTGYVFTVGGTIVSWMSRIQKCVAMSTTEAEYMAIAEAGKELNPVFHDRTKHINIRYHYIRELVSEGTLSLKKILGVKNPADMLTKVTTTKKLKLRVASTGLRDN
nr:hypothetical protein [Tanacetum cinerariifolium]